MITKIEIKNIASFDGNGVIIDDLKKVNFFFGHNGSGKSTIAKYLKDLTIADSAQRSQSFHSCSQNGYDSNQHELLVFNDQFVEDNFKTSGKQKGVFSLDEINEKVQSQIELIEVSLKALDKKNNTIVQRTNRISAITETKESELVVKCYERRRQFEFMTYKISDLLPRNKQPHYTKIESYIVRLTPDKIKTFEDIRADFTRYYEKEIQHISNVDARLYRSCRHIDRDLMGLLDTIIVSNQDIKISALIEKLNNRRWIEEGANFLELTNGICPFCQQSTITPELAKEFELLFNEEYKKQINRLQVLKANYIEYTSRLKDNLVNIRAIYNPQGGVQSIIDRIDAIAKSNIDNIDGKIEFPNQKYTFIELSEIKKILSTLIEHININNNDYKELDDKRRLLKDDVWLFMANECINDIAKFKKWHNKSKAVIASAKSHIDYYKNIIDTNKANIEQLRTQTADTTTAVNNINLCLKHAGFIGFEIKEYKEVDNIKYYYLHRNGMDGRSRNLFSTLSEGEKNFISFLYFYQLCLGTDDYDKNKSKKKIIVIDDPVSSMDNQVLFIISTLIHQLIKYKSSNSNPERAELRNSHIAQILILSHNLYFYKEVSLSMRPICTNRMHYKIGKVNDVTTIQNSKNAVITDDYLLIWNTLKEIKANLPKDKSQNIQIANMMRRVLDSYVSFVGIGKDCWGAIVDDPTDPLYIIKGAFISSINDSSHKISPFDGVYFQKITNEEPIVLFDVFKSIFKEIGAEHYEMHMGQEESITPKKTAKILAIGVAGGVTKGLTE